MRWRILWLARWQKARVVAVWQRRLRRQVGREEARGHKELESRARKREPDKILRSATLAKIPLGGLLIGSKEGTTKQVCRLPAGIPGIWRGQREGGVATSI